MEEENKESILEIIKNLKKELLIFTQSEKYSLSISSKKITASIFIAIYLAELCVYDSNINLSKTELVWFQNEYGVYRFFDNEKWIKIPELYSRLSKYILTKKT